MNQIRSLMRYHALKLNLHGNLLMATQLLKYFLSRVDKDLFDICEKQKT